MPGIQLADRFGELIGEGRLRVGIVGLGYVGLPLAIAFSRKFPVVGYDLNREKVGTINRGETPIVYLDAGAIREALGRSFIATTDPRGMAGCDAILICVPTPLTGEKEPDLSYVKSACRAIAGILRPGMFVILESTTYPGTTEEIVVPLLEGSGLRAGSDFGVAYSPERIDPGNTRFRLEEIPKVVGGITPECTRIAASLYRTIVPEVVEVRDPRTAEATKMMENIFRNVNIALVNELALIFEHMGIDAWEVIQAASSKPYGYMPFFPGPGVGGHCIPLDPYYMAYRAKRCGFIPRFIETSGEINDFMRIHVVNLVDGGLREAGRTMAGARIALVGLSYKKNIDDTRESPSLKILGELDSLGAEVRVYDPFVKAVSIPGKEFISQASLEVSLSGSDCAVFLVDHDEFKGKKIQDLAGLMRTPVVIDCRNLFGEAPGIIYRGIGKPRHT
ncbi:MAG TPA: nucleotide sugar dehydrogenase [Methanomicrobiales archaeon]|nr:nucleotide sugar dehydrogenase [Methanomicrobiales archaeon]